jgi:hypothetical protein
MAIEDRKLVHDLRNSMTVIRNLTQLMEQGVLKGSDKEQAYALILAECDKVIEVLKEK